jgi:hypothetical protein
MGNRSYKFIRVMVHGSREKYVCVDDLVDLSQVKAVGGIVQESETHGGFMKSCEQQLVEVKEAVFKHEGAKYVNEAKMQEVWKEAVKGDTVEERLSRAKTFAEKLGVKLIESRQRIERKNGRGVQESGIGDNVFTAEEKRIEKYMLAGKSYQEAFCIATSATTKVTKEPAKFTEARKARLTEFYSGVISEQDITAMAERGIEP